MAIHHWETLHAPDIPALIDDSSVAIMVLGAIEQHGAHLPLSTDRDIGEGLLAAMLERTSPEQSVFVMPSLQVGASEEHLGFPGTLSLPAPVAQATIEAIGDGLAASGIRRLMLLNSHGGNQAIMQQAGLTLRRRHGMLVVKAPYMKIALPEGWLPPQELAHGLHGGALETAMMRHLHPQRVNTRAMGHPPSVGERLASEQTRLGPEGIASFAWLAQDLHPDGVVGDAGLGSAALGERLINHYAGALAKTLEDAARLDIRHFQAESS
ncbi:creatininase family protein [Halomonas sp. 18H]|uniref:creatininase family protein n=1 Tax=Halomonas almeriensis TaxID=308163 RepID=UPI00223123A6|nr:MULTISPECIES: creatininase family protein [Halomonas]MCW4153038.1 creatininase family protein [Halomonas sp. 18H]MDN3554271.1 creatininase family protein [Halomonas almeriensis]